MTNAEQVVTHEQLIISYVRVKTLSGKVTDQLLMRNNLLSVLFAAIFVMFGEVRKIIHKLVTESECPAM